MMEIRQQDLVENPTPRVPICLVLDTSRSMTGEPIKELNEGVRQFIDDIKADEVASLAAEVAVVTFGQNVERLLDFEKIDRQRVPQMTAYGRTPMGEAVDLALDLLETRKGEYARAGVDYYQPWMVIMTDGAPTDDISIAVTRTSELVNQHRLSIFPIGIGPYVVIEILQKFSPFRRPIRLKDGRLGQFFEWLSKSVAQVSRSTPGDTVELDQEGIQGWGEL
ncbi:MAG: VWA domain-containing protein [Proteobacteria bacterium]|nr:VWA domain-containing protein [Pseudomonadota bacterium]